MRHDEGFQPNTFPGGWSRDREIGRGAKTKEYVAGWGAPPFHGWAVRSESRGKSVSGIVLIANPCTISNAKTFSHLRWCTGHF